MGEVEYCRLLPPAHVVNDDLSSPYMRFPNGSTNLPPS
jgi:hypothetical protein